MDRNTSKDYHKILGYLESAAFLWYKKKEPELAIQLLQTECIASGQFQLEELIEVADTEMLNISSVLEQLVDQNLDLPNE